MGIVVLSLYYCSLIVIIVVIIHGEHELLITFFLLPSIFFSFVFANVCFASLQEGDDCHHVSRHLCHQNHINSKLKEL
jgi:hypothetical protein